MGFGVIVPNLNADGELNIVQLTSGKDISLLKDFAVSIDLLNKIFRETQRMFICNSRVAIVCLSSVGLFPSVSHCSVRILNTTPPPPGFKLYKIVC